MTKKTKTALLLYFTLLKKSRTNLFNILVGVMLVSHPVFPQSQPSLPMLTAQSPKATAMNRYGEYPVSLYTGLVDITIPIYEININGIRVPVEFKYHASGLKFDDLPMELGYGWTLMAGGTVSRSVRGTPDGGSLSGSGQRTIPYFWQKDINQIQRYLCTASGLTNNDQKQLFYVNNGVKYPYSDSGPNSDYYSDSEYDLFTYNFLHHSGQMYFSDGNSIRIPANGLYVSSVTGLGVTDNEGIHYYFTPMDYDDYGFNGVCYLTKIISANKADTVVFDYTNYGRSNPVSKPVIDQRFEFTDKVNYGGYTSTDWSVTGGKRNKSFYPRRLNSITYRGGRIDFVYTNTTTSRNLSEIKIFDNNNQLFKTVKLLKPRTDWLDGIEFRDNANAVQQTYAFGYNGTLPTASGMDYWGYHNGRSPGESGNSYMPNFTFPYASNGGTYSLTIPGMNRAPNFTYMQQGMLTKIVYPTKGYTVFEYEAHKANNQICGGLRIKEIRSYHHDSTLLERKWYKYGTDSTGNGRAVQAISYANQSEYLRDFYREFLILENSDVGLYSQSRIKHFYSFPLTDYFASGSTVLYSEVAEYSGMDSVTNEKTVYKYTDTPDTFRPTYRGFIQPRKYMTSHWENGLLISKEVYNSSNQKIYSLSNIYSYLSLDTVPNLAVVQYADIIDGPNPSGGRPFDAEYMKHNLNETVGFNGAFSDAVEGTLFDYSNYYITTGIPVVAWSTEYRDGVTTTTTYSDHNDIGLPGRVEVSSSDGFNRVTKYKYPTDLSATAPYNSMVANRILTPVIHQEQYRGTTSLSKSVNEYKNWGNNMFEPEVLKLQGAPGAPLEDRITYHKRDSRGNPRHISKDGADHVVYLWGYNQQYPIAEIKGVPYSDVTAKISETAMNAIAAKYEPAKTDWDAINGLRSSLPNAMITTYTYKPLVGVLKMTDPRGVETEYVYDNFGRLTTVKREGAVVETYRYNYKN